MMLRVANIEDQMDMVLPLLADLCRQDRPDWSIADAIRLCKSGEWLLIVADEPGFAMVSVETGRFSLQRRLSIEAVCHPNSQLTIDDYDSFWDVLARNLECDEIVMQSKRRGWERKGWTPGWINYSRKVREVHHAVVS